MFKALVGFIEAVVETVGTIIGSLVDSTVWETQTVIAVVKALPGDRQGRRPRLLKVLVESVDAYIEIARKNHTRNMRFLQRIGYPKDLMVMTPEGGYIIRDHLREVGYATAVFMVYGGEDNLLQLKERNRALIHTAAQMTFTEDVSVEEVVRAAVAAGIAC